MIQFLARIFRGFHFIFGISAPPPGRHDRIFVLAWLGIIVCIIGFCMFLFYVIPSLYFKQ